MAVTVEGKLELFKRILFERVEEDWSEQKDKITQVMEERLSEKIKEYEKHKKAIREDGESRAQLKRKTIISKVQGDADNEIMRKKEQLFGELTELLRNWSREFIKTDRYREFLQSNIENSMNLVQGRNLSLNFTAGDLNDHVSFIKELTEKYKDQRNIELVKAEDDIIGGFTMEDKDSGIMADFSIKTLIDEGKEFMGKMLYEKLDEVLKA